MTEADFLGTLRRQLAGLPHDEIEEIVSDYAGHFREGLAEGRGEADIAEGLGDPARLAREVRAEAGFQRWAEKRTLGNLASVLFAVLALIAVDFILMLPVVAGWILVIASAGLAAVGACMTGLLLIPGVTMWGSDLSPIPIHMRLLGGIAMFGFGVGGAALLLLLTGWSVRVLARFVRLHYSVLDRVEKAL